MKNMIMKSVIVAAVTVFAVCGPLKQAFAASGDPLPIFVVTDKGDGTGTPLNALEPIGAEVAVFEKSIVFGTGGRDSLEDQDTRNYHIFGLRIDGSKVEPLWKDESGGAKVISLEKGEKVWGAPSIDTDEYQMHNVYVGTSVGYISAASPDEMRKADVTGRIHVLKLLSGADVVKPLVVEGGIVGGIDFDSQHAYTVTLDGKVIQLGGDDFSSTEQERNPIRILWWKKL
ncbi:MAG: hypothetical protein HZA20_04880 [Nitrospirae bacterium]|nr:hypothetical protein [Nitrospirota bacterium]